MPSLYRVRTAITGPNGGAQVSTHYLDALTPNTASDAADAVHTFWSTMAGQLSSQYVFQVDPLVEIIDVSTGGITGASAVTVAAVAGSVGTALAPPATQGLIRWHTGVYIGGREVRGRTFIPGILAASVTSTGGVATAFQTVASSAATAYLGWTNSVPVVYSGAHRAFAGILSGSAWSSFAVLRSRRD